MADVLTFDDLAPPSDKVVTFNDLAPPSPPSATSALGGAPDLQYIKDYALPSLGNLAWNSVAPFMHPVETGKQLGNVAKGTYDYFAGNDTPQAQEAQAVGDFYKNRYGSLEAIGQTAHNDPFGFAADLSVPLSFGGTGLERLPGVVGKIGEVAANAGRAIDPIAAGINATKNIGKGIGRGAAEVLGSPLATGAGGQTFVEAAKAGAQAAKGNLEPIKAFQQNALRLVDPASVVGMAKDAVNNMRATRSNQYVTDMAALGKNPTVLSFKDIDAALNKANAVKTFNGQNLSPSTSAIRTELATTINDWKQLDPTIFHTAAGLDALKQKVGDVLGQTQFGKPDHAVAEGIYRAIKKTITDQDPAYANYMKHYAEASDTIHQMESTLSLNPKAKLDTQLRKLQSVMRNNVNTNYGQRLTLADQLAQNGAPNIKAALAGQASNALMPRGIPIGAAHNLGTQALIAGLSGFNPFLLPTLAIHSPAVMGQASAAGGALGGLAGLLPLKQAARVGFQSRSANQ